MLAGVEGGNDATGGGEWHGEVVEEEGGTMVGAVPTLCGGGDGAPE